MSVFSLFRARFFVLLRFAFRMPRGGAFVLVTFVSLVLGTISFIN